MRIENIRIRRLLAHKVISQIQVFCKDWLMRLLFFRKIHFIDLVFSGFLCWNLFDYILGKHMYVINFRFSWLDRRFFNRFLSIERILFLCNVGAHEIVLSFRHLRNLSLWNMFPKLLTLFNFLILKWINLAVLRWIDIRW